MKKKLLDARSIAFSKISLKDPQQIRDYRKQRELEEEALLRFDPEAYVCPFLGWIQKNRSGCMLHPQHTGMAGLQNYSFYGTSICQSYDCPVKEIDHSLHYARLISECFGHSLVYSRLFPDLAFYHFTEEHQILAKLAGKTRASPEYLAFKSLCCFRLKTQRGLHSFEIMYADVTLDESRFASQLKAIDSCARIIYFGYGFQAAMQCLKG